MPTKKTPAEAVITQVKNLSVKSPEELAEIHQVEVIKVTPTDTTPAAIMSVPAPTPDILDPLAMDTTVHTTTMEELIETLIATSMMGNTMTTMMTKGFFTIQGKEFIR